MNEKYLQKLQNAMFLCGFNRWETAFPRLTGFKKRVGKTIAVAFARACPIQALYFGPVADNSFFVGNAEVWGYDIEKGDLDEQFSQPALGLLKSDEIKGLSQKERKGLVAQYASKAMRNGNYPAVVLSERLGEENFSVSIYCSALD